MTNKIINVHVGGPAPRERIVMAVSLWVCQRCSTVIRSDETPKECFEDQGGCRRGSEDAGFLGPFPEGAKAALEIDATYRKLRLEDGLNEPDAIEVLDRSREEPPEVIREILRQTCVLDEWPVDGTKRNGRSSRGGWTSRTSNIGWAD